MSDFRIVPTEKDFFVGKCQSCRHSQEGNMRGEASTVLFCLKDGGQDVTKANWQCGRYEYEPGSLG